MAEKDKKDDEKYNMLKEFEGSRYSGSKDSRPAPSLHSQASPLSWKQLTDPTRIFW